MINRKFSQKFVNFFPINPNAGCTLFQREPETMRERECRWKHSPCLGCYRVASGAHVSPRQLSLFQQSVMSVTKGLVWLSHGVITAKIKYTLGHTILVFIFDSFLLIHIPGYFQEFGKKHPQGLIQSGRYIIFEKKIQNFNYPDKLRLQQRIYLLQRLCFIFAFVCTPSPCSCSS